MTLPASVEPVKPVRSVAPPALVSVPAPPFTVSVTGEPLQLVPSSITPLLVKLLLTVSTALAGAPFADFTRIVPVLDAMLPAVRVFA